MISICMIVWLATASGPVSELSFEAPNKYGFSGAADSQCLVGEIVGLELTTFTLTAGGSHKVPATRILVRAIDGLVGCDAGEEFVLWSFNAFIPGSQIEPLLGELSEDQFRIAGAGKFWPKIGDRLLLVTRAAQSDVFSGYHRTEFVRMLTVDGSGQRELQEFLGFDSKRFAREFGLDSEVIPLRDYYSKMERNFRLEPDSYERIVGEIVQVLSKPGER